MSRGGGTRRIALLAGVALLTASCAPARSHGSQPAGSRPLPSLPPTAFAASPSPSPTPVLPPEVDPQAVAERFRGARANQWGLFVDGVENGLAVSHHGSAPLVALTLDACGGSSGGSVDEV